MGLPAGPGKMLGHEEDLAHVGRVVRDLAITTTASTRSRLSSSVVDGPLGPEPLQDREHHDRDRDQALHPGVALEDGEPDHEDAAEDAAQVKTARFRSIDVTDARTSSRGLP